MIVNSVLFPGMTYAMMIEEAARELATRRRIYPDRVNTGRMKQAEADYQIALMAGIAADTVRMADVGGAPIPPCPHKFTWAQRRSGIGHELAMRARFYPQWIAAGRLRQAAADDQIAAMKAILWRYDSGFDWTPANGIARLTASAVLAGLLPNAAQRATDAEMRAIWHFHTGNYYANYYQLWPSSDAANGGPQKPLLQTSMI